MTWRISNAETARSFMVFMLPAVLVLFFTTIYPMLYAGYLSFRSYDLAKLFVPRMSSSAGPTTAKFCRPVSFCTR